MRSFAPAVGWYRPEPPPDPNDIPREHATAQSRQLAGGWHDNSGALASAECTVNQRPG